MTRRDDSGFRRLQGCVDYRVYTYPLDPGVGAAAYTQLRHRLQAIGKAEPERMGVTYVRGPWGFLVIPQRGFPELRLSLFHDTAATDAEPIFNAIRAACELTRAMPVTGDIDE